ncbi:TPA: hypothetical protein N0F65_003547 [Lagenidium giganteum]|uniref:Uncharacterized protein n=1 Tax=Lagenidium giganteum TaxID=4803 RepID=A0AAV2Z0B2_9STRA|nr:TPA: hypothetical protein N0F65_003547 [Lagenidium giganteum]
MSTRITPLAAWQSSSSRIDVLAISGTTIAAGAAVAEALSRWQRARSDVFDRCLPFSWFRVISSLVSYVLLCSDVLRSGIGIRSLADHTPLEPNSVQLVGPWAYSVQRISWNDTADTIPIWSYKFDTTSVSWRSLARLYNATAFPDCVHYRSECKTDMLNQATAFAMMDQLATHTAQWHNNQGTNHRPSIVPRAVVRSTFQWHDRLHHYLMPAFFTRPWKRTNQATYFPPFLLSNLPVLGVCGLARRLRPAFCEDLWPNFRRSCRPVDAPRCQVGHVSVDIQARYQALQREFPDAVVDLTVLSSVEDLHANKGGLSIEYFRRFDVSTILRVRSCPGGLQKEALCQTMVVDDFRYEGAVYVTDVVEWFTIVAALRVMAQTYFGLRLVFLFAGTFAARRQEKKYQHEAVSVVWSATIGTVARMPCQGIVYGSPFPIACYVLAHVIDAPMSYRIVCEYFVTRIGAAIAGNFFQACVMTAIQMRNIWLLALVLQCVVWRPKWRQWDPAKGVVGVPDFTLSVLSSVTIVAHYRAISFRDTRVFDVFELQDGAHDLLVLHAARYSLSARGMSLEGVLVDVKCLTVLVTMLAVIVILVSGALPCALGRPTGSHITVLASRAALLDTKYSTLVVWIYPCCRRSHAGNNATRRHAEALQGLARKSSRTQGVRAEPT